MTTQPGEYAFEGKIYYFARSLSGYVTLAFEGADGKGKAEAAAKEMDDAFRAEAIRVAVVPKEWMPRHSSLAKKLYVPSVEGIAEIWDVSPDGTINIYAVVVDGKLWPTGFSSEDAAARYVLTLSI